MLTELRKVIPSFLRRVDVADRGVAWSSYLESTRDATAQVVERLFPDGLEREAAPPEVLARRLRPRRGGQGPRRRCLLGT